MSRTPRLLALVASVVSIAPLGCITVNVGGAGERDMQETVIHGEQGPKVALIEVDGMITSRSTRTVFGYEIQSPLARVTEQLDTAREDEEVKAIILRIDTPGGTATASSLLHREIERFKEDRNVPVIAQLMGTATSGGYYVAVATDKVIAHPTTVTGSIGVIFLGVEVSGLMEKLGITDQTVTGGEYKDAGSPLRPMTREERAQLQAIIDDLHDDFRAAVDAGRPNLDRAQVDAVSDGRIFSAPQALELGLVDAIGSLEESLGEARQRIGAPEVRLIRYHRPQEWRRTAHDRSAAADSRPLDSDFRALSAPLSTPGFHYLWWPGVE